MTNMFTDRAPDACTLPTVERPVRMAEFRTLLAVSLRAQTRLSATRLRWVVDAAAEAEARDLTRRESECCTFVGFSLGSTELADVGRVVVVDVDVPVGQVTVLDALQSLAAQATEVVS